MRKARIIFPTLVIRGSFSPAGMERPSFSASTIIERNFKIQKRSPPKELLSCLKKTGPLSSNLIAIAVKINIGDKIIKERPDKTISKARFKIRSLSDSPLFLQT